MGLGRDIDSGKLLRGTGGGLCRGCCGVSFPCDNIPPITLSFSNIAKCVIGDGSCWGYGYVADAGNPNQAVQLIHIGGVAYGALIGVTVGVGDWAHYDFYSYATLHFDSCPDVYSIRQYAINVLAVYSGWNVWYSYIVNQHVTHNGTNYLCTTAHTARYVDAEPGIGSVWSAYWEIRNRSYPPPSPYSYDSQVTFDFFEGGGLITENPTVFNNFYTDIDDCCDNNTNIRDHFLNGHGGSVSLSW